MSDNNKISKQLNNCPVYDMADSDIKPPTVLEADLAVMDAVYVNHPNKILIYPKISHVDDRVFIEIYAYNKIKFPVKFYKRFLLLEGFSLDETSENEFIRFIKEDNLFIEQNDIVAFQEALLEAFPKVNIPVYSPNEVGIMLENVYYTLFNGPKKVLFEAGLYRIAFDLDNIDDFNIIGNTPEEILGVSSRCLKLLNDFDLTNRLNGLNNRKFLNWIFENYSSYLDREGISKYQYLYIEQLDLFCDNNPFENDYIVDDQLFEMMKDVKSDFEFKGYMEYVKNSALAGERNPYKKLPVPIDVSFCNSILQDIVYAMEYGPGLDEQIKLNNDKFSYENDDFKCVNLLSLDDFIREDLWTRNDLIKYARRVANKEMHVTTLVNKKAKDSLDNGESRAYMTICIYDGVIERAELELCELPYLEDLKVLEAFASANNLELDLCSVYEDESIWELADREEDQKEFYDFVSKYMDIY